MDDSITIEKNTSKSIKWSFLGELAVKLIAPITNMILARLLLPEVFGIVATISVVISLSELLADSGFAKAIIQRDFLNPEEFNKSASTAFWTTISMSFVLFIVILIFNEQIAALVGSPGYGTALSIASIQIPIHAISSIHLAILKRNFKFQKIFWVRLVSALIPITISTTLALLNFSYWSLIISSVVSVLIQTILIIILTKWMPKFFFGFSHLKQMFAFSFLTLIEALLVWLNSSLDIFVIVYIFDSSLTGMFRLASTTTHSFLNIVTAVFIPVLFSSLSRLKEDPIRFKEMVAKFQKMIAFCLFPIGAGVFLYRNLATTALFGEGWSQVSIVVGLFALILSFITPINNVASIIYFSKNKPIFSIFSQIIFIFALCIIYLVTYFFKLDFETFVIYRGLASLTLVITSVIFLSVFHDIPVMFVVKNIYKPLIASSIMFVVGFVLERFLTGQVWNIVSMIFCAILYFSICYLFFKKDIIMLLGFIFKSKNKKILEENKEIVEQEEGE